MSFVPPKQQMLRCVVTRRGSFSIEVVSVARFSASSVWLAPERLRGATTRERRFSDEKAELNGYYFHHWCNCAEAAIWFSKTQNKLEQQLRDQLNSAQQALLVLESEKQHVFQQLQSVTFPRPD